MSEKPSYSSLIATRGAQMFPTLTEAEIARLARFGSTRSYPDGAAIVRSGESGHGLVVILSGGAEVRRHVKAGHDDLITTHEAGSFIGELAQLSGRPALVDVNAIGNVEALVIPPERLRAVLVAEAGLGERIMRALILRRVGLLESGAGGPIIVGRAGSGDVLRLANFLRRNGHPHQILDSDSDSCAQTLVARFEVTPEELPIVLCPDGQLLRNPTEAQLGRCIGLVRPIDRDKLFDVIVVGAGPAGLATSVYAGSEGLSVLALDCRAFGGQAGASARIENYLGFPTGISGMALMGRAHSQAQKFGVEMAIPDEAVRLGGGDGRPWEVSIGAGEVARARAIVIATGARYRRLDLPELDLYENSSVHYWASPLEAQLCAGREVALVGAGNSAGQAAVYLSEHVGRVTMIARRAGLRETMSSYLVDRIEAAPNIDVVVGCEVSGLEGEGALEAIRWRDRATGEEHRREICQLFLFIGAEPNTDWLSDSAIALDERGFVRTGASHLPLETSRRGVFAVGDVRAGSVKRVAASVGDGAQVVAALHAYLAETGAAMPPLEAAAAPQPVPA